MTEVSLQQVVKRYGQLEVVHAIDLEIRHSEFVVLVGPSGCGKSTTLRMIAGLEEISDGTIKIGDKVVNKLPPRDRNISMVFQNYALYPHMSVRENLGFGLKIAKHPESEINKRVEEAAEILGLGMLMDRLPAELSGGQRQRVAMGRAIVRNPDVFLFDEPLSNLDAKLRVQMRTEIKKLHKRVNNTIVYVTHDQVEAMTLADRIVIMRDGHIEQVGSPLKVFDHPNNTFVASFIGSPPMNQLSGKVIEKEGVPHIDLEGNLTIPVPNRARNHVQIGQQVIVGVRPDDLTPEGHGMSDVGEIVSFDLSVSISEPLGTESILFSTIGNNEVQGKMLNPRPIEGEERLTFNLSLDRTHLFDAETGQNVLGHSDGSN
ncbi:fe(3+)-transporting ATPase [Maritalea myrionectae]|uniref:Fe(3+)-transporting ATPase n=1 Tax=Maritalea myrionectae TaxID=454601 RepID=A0A2R4MFR6_9HYPH|nr:sn-glycerol-3-phosphate ABC transporter ATP-binding protein UgpC [Maritalea myrionectae]AVX04891.1 fe(3+)-transporting ATPase [Maritalea myrionectae]